VPSRELPVRIARIGSGIGHKVEVDGHDIANDTVSLSLEISPAEMPVLTLRLLVADDVDTLALVRLEGATAEALKAMGWTPPTEGPVT
jgi:hypothetical protein